MKLPPWWPRKPWNLFVTPRVSACASDDGKTVLRVEGVVCDLCLARSAEAVSDLPGVEVQSTDRLHDEIVIQGRVGPDAATELVNRVVLFRPARRMLGLPRRLVRR